MGFSPLIVAMMLGNAPLASAPSGSPTDVPATQSGSVVLPPSASSLPAAQPSTPVPTVAAPPPPPPPASADEIIVQASRHAPPEDPIQAVNTVSFEATQVVDKNVVNPAAITYKRAIPAPVRSGVRNFFNNLGEPVTTINYLLQMHVGKAGQAFGRFALNSTIGIGGLIDFAKRRPFKLPLRSNGFANTLGYYGVKPGPFLFLPLIGPTTVRDVIGLVIDKLVVPTVVGKPFNRPYYSLPAAAVGSLDCRNAFDAQLRKQRDEPNPYAASRQQYLQSRQAEIEGLHSRSSGAPVGSAAAVGCRLPTVPQTETPAP